MSTHCSKACGRKYKVIKAHKLNVIAQEKEKASRITAVPIGNARLIKKEKKRKQKRKRKGIKQPPRIRQILKVTK